MGENKKTALRVNFNKKLKLEFHGVKVTSDAGWVRLMPRIAEKLEFMKARALTVCIKAGI